MTNSNKAWDDFRGSLVGLVSAVSKDIAAQAPKAADDLAARAPKVADRMAGRVTAAAPHLIEGVLAAAPFLIRRSRRPILSGPLALAGAFVGGALLMHFLDPEKGEARREEGKERIAAMIRLGGEQAERVSRRAGASAMSQVDRSNSYDGSSVSMARPV